MRSLLFLFSACTAPVASPCPAGVTPALETHQGCVLGVGEDGLEAFLGVPYALPPVGERRFAHPLPAPPRSDVWLATRPGLRCVQGDHGGEDCLYLNVVRPEGARDLPVLVFVHGGGFTSGSASQPTFLGGALTTGGADVPDLARNAVVVTMEYRLGPLGWLAHPALTAAGAPAGNQGLWDVVQALEWVNDHVEALGGDPDRVLLFGQSAGSLITCSLLAAPPARGLFDAVVAQSGSCSAIDRTLTEPGLKGRAGWEQGERLADVLGCDGTPDEVRDCLRAAPADAVQGALRESSGPFSDGEMWGPLVDGEMLPTFPDAAFRDGDIARVPVTLGFNADDGTFGGALRPGVSRAIVRREVEEVALLFGWDPDATLERYAPVAAREDPWDQWTDFTTESLFACPTLRELEWLQAHTEARGYWFTRTSLSRPEWGATHGAELPWVFGTGEADEAPTDLGPAMQRAWVSLAGDAPEVPPLGAWPELGADHVLAELDDQRRLVTGTFDASCAWQAAQGIRGPVD